MSKSGVYEYVYKSASKMVKAHILSNLVINRHKIFRKHQ
jgi:hypothetical protein